MDYKGHKKIAPIFAPILTAGLMLAASAAVASELQSRVSFQIVETGADGAETMVDRAAVRPGETIEYEISHVNDADESLSGIVVMAPIPNGVTFVETSAESSIEAIFEIQAEMDPDRDGLEWSTLPATRKVATANGEIVVEPVPETAIEAVRWTLTADLESGATSLNTYRVVVD